MIYAYNCHCCKRTFDVVKPVVEWNKVEFCPACGKEASREVAPRRVFFSNTAVQEKAFQPAVGKPMTNRELKAHAKQEGWVEVGNEDQGRHIKPVYHEYPEFRDGDLSDLLRKEGT